MKRLQVRLQSGAVDGNQPAAVAQRFGAQVQLADLRIDQPFLQSEVVLAPLVFNLDLLFQAQLVELGNVVVPQLAEQVAQQVGGELTDTPMESKADDITCASAWMRAVAICEFDSISASFSSRLISLEASANSCVLTAAAFVAA
jgi:hypothetical protein